MVTYDQVRCTDLDVYVCVVCVWSVKVADVCVILVGDFTSWVKPSSVAERERQRDRETHRHTHRLTDLLTERLRDRENRDKNR